MTIGILEIFFYSTRIEVNGRGTPKTATAAFWELKNFDRLYKSIIFFM